MRTFRSMRLGPTLLLGVYLTLGVASAAGKTEAENSTPPVALTLTVDVQVYNSARIAPKDLKRAFNVTSQIFAESGIELAWTVTPASHLEVVEFAPTQTGRPCPAPLPSHALALRIIRKAPPGIDGTNLGFALPCAIHMPSITVYADRIEAIAQHTTAIYYRILAHVIAHELGHVLLRSSEHAEAGIMRARWDRANWYRVSAGILEFTANQRERMRAELQQLAIQALWSDPSIR